MHLFIGEILYSILRFVPNWIEPTSLAVQAGILTTTLHHPGTKYIKFASSNNPWQMVLLMLLLQCFHTVRAQPILLNRQFSPDPLISRMSVVLTTTLQHPGTKYIK